jgi:D-alanine transfer protein
MSLELEVQNSKRQEGLGQMKKIGRSFLHPLTAVILAILLFVLSITGFDSGLKFWLEKVYLKPGVVEAMGVNPHFDTFQGSILQQRAFTTSGVLPLFGSSEMSMIIDYHPARVLTPETGVTPFLVGKGGSQSIIHVLTLASLGELKGKKVAIFLTPQWFGKGGIPHSTFAGNFSALHAYQVLYSPELSTNLKRKIIKRILEFPEAYKDFPYLQKMLSTELDTGYRSEFNRIWNWVPARMEYAALEYQDVFKTRWHIKKLAQKTIDQYATKPAQPSGKDWDKLREEAKAKAITVTDNNSFGMDNTFFQEYLISRLKEKKDADRDDTLSSSPEYDDLKLLMQVLKEKGVRPLFVIIPMNGKWYDYSGLKRSEREFCYRKLASLVQEEGYPLADFSSHEYEDYYLKDPWHLAWKGWVDVNQRLYEFYTSN